MSETFPDDVMFAAREAALEMCPWDEPDERAAWKAAKWPIIARAIAAERERCAKIAEEWTVSDEQRGRYPHGDWYITGLDDAGDQIADAIRGTNA